MASDMRSGAPIAFTILAGATIGGALLTFIVFGTLATAGPITAVGLVGGALIGWAVGRLGTAPPAMATPTVSDLTPDDG